MRQIDAIDHASAVRGVYVVRAVAGPCAGDPPTSSRACSSWRVLARVAEITIPRPTAIPPAVTTRPLETPPPGYPVDRVLTTSELETVMTDPQPAPGTTLVASVTIDAAAYCPANPDPTVGVIEGMSSQVCVAGNGLTMPKVTGIFALRYLSPGVLMNLGEITPASPSRVAFHPAQGWPWEITGYRYFLVGGYLVHDSGGWSIVDSPEEPAPPGGLTWQRVELDAAAGIDAADPSQYGVYVVAAEWGAVPASSMGPQGDGITFHVLARLTYLALPASPIPEPAATPVIQPPVTVPPVPPATPVAEPSASPRRSYAAAG
jgi:hypothetical protein